MINSPPNQPRARIEWALWLQWTLANTLGWLVGLIIFGEIWIGVGLGLAQWLVLRRETSISGWWILVSGLAWVGSWALIVSGFVVPPGGGILSSLIAGALTGLLLGVGQWLLLRRRVFFASIWILVNTSVWAVGFSGMIAGAELTGAVTGAVTGLALDWLLRYPRIEVEDG
jgi:serine/threonine-protein kinase